MSSALAQGREVDGNDVKAVIKIFAEQFLLYGFFHQAVGGGDRSVDADGADSFKFHLLDGAEGLIVAQEGISETSSEEESLSASSNRPNFFESLCEPPFHDQEPVDEQSRAMAAQLTLIKVGRAMG
jgi:hypothetical protein